MSSIIFRSLVHQNKKRNAVEAPENQSISPKENPIEEATKATILNPH